MESKKHIKKIIKILILILALILVFGVFVNLLMYFSVKDSILELSDAYNVEADCILVLGAGINDDGTPKKMLEDRLKIGIDLFKNGKNNTILMSGDHGRIEYDEVNSMKKYAMDYGISEDRIFMDHAGFSTYDSIYRAKEIFGAKKIIIVTQKYHLYRALYIAKSFGIDAVGVPSDLRSYSYSGQAMREIREFIARTKDWFFTVIKPEPVCLGESISFEESGTVTNG